MKMTNNQINKLRSFFIRELPLYFTKRMNEIINKKELDDYIEKKKKQYGELYEKEFIMKNSPRGFCRSISQVVFISLQIYGFNAETRDVRFVLGNKKAQLIYKQKGFDGLSKEINKKPIDLKIYTLGIGWTNRSDDFHTIVLINNDLLLDMTASEFRRIEKGIIINNYWTSLDDLKKKYKCILIYDLLPNTIFDTQASIFKHPKFLNILNYILEQISIKLQIPKKRFSRFNINEKGIELREGIHKLNLLEK